MAQDTIGREMWKPSIHAETSGGDQPVKPFTFDSDAAREAGILPKLIKPFKMDPKKSKRKLYLILKYYTNNTDGGEDEKDWEFFKGTTQELYDHVKAEILIDTRFNVMRSKIFVDSPSITIGTKNTSVFGIMRGLQDSKKVVESSSFDISDYYYDEEDTEVENGEEQESQ